MEVMGRMMDDPSVVLRSSVSILRANVEFKERQGWAIFGQCTENTSDPPDAEHGPLLDRDEEGIRLGGGKVFQIWSQPVLGTSQR